MKQVDGVVEAGEEEQADQEDEVATDGNQENCPPPAYPPSRPPKCRKGLEIDPIESRKLELVQQVTFAMVQKPVMTLIVPLATRLLLR